MKESVLAQVEGVGDGAIGVDHLAAVRLGGDLLREVRLELELRVQSEQSAVNLDDVEGGAGVRGDMGVQRDWLRAGETQLTGGSVTASAAVLLCCPVPRLIAAIAVAAGGDQKDDRHAYSDH